VLLVRQPGNSRCDQATDDLHYDRDALCAEGCRVRSSATGSHRLRPPGCPVSLGEVQLGTGHNRTRATRVERSTRWLRAALQNGRRPHLKTACLPPARRQLAQPVCDSCGVVRRSCCCSAQAHALPLGLRAAGERRPRARLLWRQWLRPWRGFSPAPDAASAPPGAGAGIRDPRVCGFYLGGLGLGGAPGRPASRCSADVLPRLPEGGVRVLGAP